MISPMFFSKKFDAQNKNKLDSPHINHMISKKKVNIKPWMENWNEKPNQAFEVNV